MGLITPDESDGFEIHCPEFINRYFRSFYELSKCTEQKSTSSKDNKRSLKDSLNGKHFVDVAAAYRLIEQDSINILVPYDMEAFKELTERLEKDGRLTKSWIRDARPYTISLHRPKLTEEIWKWLSPAHLYRGLCVNSFDAEWFVYRPKRRLLCGFRICGSGRNLDCLDSLKCKFEDYVMKPATQIIEVWGGLAVFIRPELKIERFSYPLITPSAARGVLDAILARPDAREPKNAEFRWQVKLRNTKPAYAKWFDNQIAAIFSKIDSQIPATFALKEQSLFALGYYQQKAGAKPSDDSQKPNNETEGKKS